MTNRELIGVLEVWNDRNGWSGEIKVLGPDGKPIKGARIVETENGPAVKLS